MVLKNLPKALPKTVVKTTSKIAMKLSKNSPQIMVGAGVVIATAGFVIGIINATKIKDTTAISEAKVDELQSKKAECEKNPESTESQNIIIECDKELRKVKVEAAWSIFKLLGIPIIMFTGGMAMSLGGHLILLKRFGQLSSAFATLQQTFEKYRQMNIAEHGEECDRRYRYGVVGETEGKVTVTDENGKEKQKKVKMPIIDPEAAASMYTFEFSERTSAKCPKDPVNAISFLRSQEKFWNVWMTGRGKPVTLYMILNDLGIELDSDDPRNDYVMIAGWRPNGDGDNCIDFGIMRGVNKPALDMLSNTVMLNFNCDGNLYGSTRYTKDGKKVC